ncbi:MAG: carboxypeptidase-like regulatory domain-containing protein [Planctomycetaceae bacterium]
MMIRVQMVLCCLSFLAVTGCGGATDLPPLAGVSGTVTLNGQPLEGARVVFTPTEGAKQESLGITDSAGHYELMFSRAMGAKVGDHKVQISKREYPETSHDDSDGKAAPVKKPKRSAHDDGSGGGSQIEDGGHETINSEFNTSSTLKATVKKGENNVFDFDVRGI